jgi:hypothetical protein
MGGAVVVVVRVNSIAPGSTPLICFKDFLESGGRIAWWQLYGMPVNEQREFAVGNRTIVSQHTSCDLGRIDERAKMIRHDGGKSWLFHAIT